MHSHCSAPPCYVTHLMDWWVFRFLICVLPSFFFFMFMTCRTLLGVSLLLTVPSKCSGTRLSWYHGRDRSISIASNKIYVNHWCDCVPLGTHSYEHRLLFPRQTQVFTACTDLIFFISIILWTLDTTPCWCVPQHICEWTGPRGLCAWGPHTESSLTP